MTMQEEVESGDRRRALVAIRDYLVNELEGNRCRSCQMSQFRTGDTAALVLRLQKVLEEIHAMPVPGDEKKEKHGLAKLRSIGGGAAAAAYIPPSDQHGS